MLEGFLPSRTDLDNGDLKKISEIVKAGSVRETLTHLVLWQEKNMQYWWERGYIDIPFYIFIGIFVGFPFGVCCSIIFIFDYEYLFGIAFGLVGVGGINSLCIYLKIRSRNIRDFTFGDIFRCNLSVEKILRYRMGVCRDYAKLTMAMLSILYPDDEKYKKYFITIPGHVVSAIEVDGTRYVLERRLPILLVNDWLLLQKEKHKMFSLFIKEKGWSNGQLKVGKKLKPRTRLETRIDTSQIERDLILRLKIQYKQNAGECTLKIPMADFALCYADNEITHFSFVEALKNKVENEFGNEIHKISKIIVNQVGRDIGLEISISVLESQAGKSCLLKDLKKQH